MRIKKPEENKKQRNIYFEIEKRHKIQIRGLYDKVIIFSDRKEKLKSHSSCNQMEKISLNSKRNKNNNTQINNELNQHAHWRSINDAYLKRNIILPPIIHQLKYNLPRNQRENNSSIVIGTKVVLNDNNEY